MKKTIVLAMCALGVFSMLSTSCKKNEDTKAGNHFTYSIIAMEDEDFDGRVFIDPWNQPKWQNQDIVRIYNVDEDDFMNCVSGEFMATSEDGATVTDLQSLTGPIGEMQTCYMAYFPGDEKHVTGTLQAGNKETFTLDATQVGQVDPVYGGLNIDRKALAMASRIEEGSHFPFKAIAGIARIKLRQAQMLAGQGRYIVDKIELTDNQWTLNGKIALDITALNEEDITYWTNYYKANGIDATMGAYAAGIGYEPVAPGTKSIMLDCTEITPESLKTPGPSVACYYYFGLRPFALGEGFTLKLFGRDRANDNQKVTLTVTNWAEPRADRAYCVEPNRIKNFTYIIDEMVPEEW